MADDAVARARVAGLFDQLAPSYDQGPVPWFGPIATRLVELAAPRPGDKALDVGASRGAATFPLAEAVGPGGHVTAVDLSEAMCSLLRVELRPEVADRVEVIVGEVGPQTPGAGSFDLLTASLVLFFDPAPEATLRAWVDVLRPGGRIALSTFGPIDPAWGAAEGVLLRHAPGDVLDPRTSGTRGPFASTDAMAALLGSCGVRHVDSHDEPLEVVLPDADAWRAWTMSLGFRQVWLAIPEGERETAFAAAAAELEANRGADGRLHLTQQVRYTTGRVPR